MMPTLTELKAKRVEALKQSAVQFANDYGPLPAANNGDEKARFEVAKRLTEILKKNGLKIVKQ